MKHDRETKKPPRRAVAPLVTTKIESQPKRPPATQLDFWPALILCYDLEDVVSMKFVVAKARKLQPSLPEVKIQVCSMLGITTKGTSRMFRTEAEVPAEWRSSVIVQH